MQLEEVLIKLGVDTSQVEPALLKAKLAVENAGEAHQKTFIKAGSAAKGFKKILEEITTASPVLGYALKTAISPIVGTMAIAVSLFTVFKRQIDDLNASLDKKRDWAGMPIGNLSDFKNKAKDRAAEVARMIKEADAENASKGGSVESRMSAQMTSIKQAADYAKKLRDEDYLDQHRFIEDLKRKKEITEEQFIKYKRHLDDLQRVEEEQSAQKSAQKQLQVLAEARRKLADEGIIAERARDAAAKNVSSPTRIKLLLQSAALSSEMKSKIEELMMQMPKLQEASNEEEGKFLRMGFWEWLKPAETRGESAQEKYAKAKAQLADYRNQLQLVEDRTRKLTEADKDAEAELKRKQAALTDLINRLKSVVSEQAKLGGLQQQPQAGPTIDPKTGGIAYRPLEYRGIEYRPLPGAPGFKSIMPQATIEAQKTPEQLLSDLNKQMADLVSAATRDGMMIQIRDQ